MVFPIVTYSYESWTIKKAVPKNWCFWTVVLKKTLESSLDSKEIKPVNLKGNQPWILIGRTDAKAEAPILWPPDAKSRLIGKDPDAGKDWSQKEKRVTGWNGWMASPMQWTWTWASSGRRWGTGKPGVLQSMGLWRVGHNLATEQQQQFNKMDEMRNRKSKQIYSHLWKWINGSKSNSLKNPPV